MLQEAFTELSGFCQHVNATFEAALARFEAQGGKSVNDSGMEVDGGQGNAPAARVGGGRGEAVGDEEVEEEEDEEEGGDQMES